MSPAAPEPFTRFGQLLAEAQARVTVRDFNAMVVASVDEAGNPSARVVLLKEFDARGFVFYTNLQSRKGRELTGQKKAALVLHWPELGVQVRAEGAVEQVADAESDAYFASRPRLSQVGAWASHQSAPLSSREALLQRVAEVEQRYAGQAVPRPPHWGGLRLVPSAVEFWQDVPNRLHVREQYLRARPGAPWTLQLLNP
ncbi:MAG: pyridoxamine 5'-phosphate oxidase [Deltaproteobacteria bacterium]|nr:pyridoxamine 5'-phosphate oxidase [Deltaproteobacteria bacterium]